MKITHVCLAVSALILSMSAAHAAPEDNQPLAASSKTEKTEELKINIQSVEITGASSTSNTQALQNYAASQLVGRGAKSIADIQAVAKEMTQLFFKNKGFELSRVYVPVQTLDEQNSVLKLSILEGKYGEIKIKGGEAYRANLIEKRLGLHSGEQLETQRLERGLLLIDDLPGVKVASINAVPGKNTGESDYTITLAPENKVSFTAVTDNQGAKATGENRLTARAAWSNPTGNGDELEAGFIYSGKGLTAGQVAYSIPFSIGTMQGWKASVAASRLNYRLTQASVQSLDAYGTSDGLSLAATYPIIRTQDTNVGFSAQINSQKLKDYILQQQFNDKSSKTLSLGLSGDFQRIYSKSLGVSSISWTAANTFGRLTINDPFSKFIDSLGAETEGNFNHTNGSVSLTQSMNSISPRLSTYVAMSGQFSNKNLDSSEKFVVTGPNSVRGYSQGTVSADTGVFMNAEVRYNLPINSDLTTSLYAFYDKGYGKIYKNSYSNDINSQSVSAAGLGMTAHHRSGVFASLTLSKGYGYKVPANLEKKDNTFAWFQLGYRY